MKTLPNPTFEEKKQGYDDTEEIEVKAVFDTSQLAPVITNRVRAVLRYIWAGIHIEGGKAQLYSNTEDIGGDASDLCEEVERDLDDMILRRFANGDSEERAEILSWLDALKERMGTIATYSTNTEREGFVRMPVPARYSPTILAE